jgi:hypothetical protein
VKRIDALFDIEREINGLSPAKRHAVRQERSVTLVTERGRWMIETRDKLSRGHHLSKAFNNMLRRWSSAVFTGCIRRFRRAAGGFPGRGRLFLRRSCVLLGHEDRLREVRERAAT